MEGEWSGDFVSNILDELQFQDCYLIKNKFIWLSVYLKTNMKL